ANSGTMHSNHSRGFVQHSMERTPIGTHTGWAARRLPPGRVQPTASGKRLEINSVGPACPLGVLTRERIALLELLAAGLIKLRLIHSLAPSQSEIARPYLFPPRTLLTASMRLILG